jgi:hypothetical protein
MRRRSVQPFADSITGNAGPQIDNILPERERTCGRFEQKAS